MAHPDRAVCNCLFRVVCAGSDKLGLVEVGGFQKVPSSDCLCDQETDHRLWRGGRSGVGGLCPWIDVLQVLRPKSCL